MPTNKKQEEQPIPHASVIIAQRVDHSALAKAMRWADKERRSNAAVKDAERALSVLVRNADEIANLAGDVPTDGRTVSPLEQERFARRIARLSESLGKVREQVAELAAA